MIILKTFDEYLEEGNPLARDWSHGEKGLSSIIISANRYGKPDDENEKNMQEMYNEIRKRGFGYRKTQGVWKNDQGIVEHEPSVYITAKGTTPEHEKELIDFGHEMMKKYNQDAFIHNHPTIASIVYKNDGSTTTYGTKKSYNPANAGSETQFNPRKPLGTRPKFTYRDSAPSTTKERKLP